LANFPFENYFGLPISDYKAPFEPASSTDALTRALWWENGMSFRTDKYWGPVLRAPRRRSQFPSWSWAGWAGPLLMPVCNDIADVGLDSSCNPVHESPLTATCRIGLNGQVMELFDLRSLKRSTQSLPRLSGNLIIECWTLLLRIQRASYYTVHVNSSTGAFICEGSFLYHKEQELPHTTNGDNAIYRRLITYPVECIVLSVDDTDAISQTRLIMIDTEDGRSHRLGTLLIPTASVCSVAMIRKTINFV
jgi:hypothetical protein